MNKFDIKSLFLGAYKVLSELTFVPIVFGITIYYLLTLFSFNPQDPSLFSAVVPILKIHNYGGSLGAKISGFLFFYIGFISYLAILPMLVWAYFFKRTSLKKSSLTLLLLGLLVISAAWFLVLIKPHIAFKGVIIPSAGFLGHAFFQYTMNTFGKVGAFVLFLGLVSFIVTNLISPTICYALCCRILEQTKTYYRTACTFLHKSKLRIIEATGFKKAVLAQTEQVAPPLRGGGQNDVLREYATISNTQPVAQEVEQTIPTITHQEYSAEEVADSTTYLQPSIDVFKKSDHFELTHDQISELEKTKALLLKTLEEFSVKGEIIAIQPGPVVTVFEFQPDAGTKQSKVIALVDDIALALRVESIIIYPVLGKRALGIQVPNKTRRMVRLGDLFNDPTFINHPSPLAFAAGKSLSGKPTCIDITEMPHLLIAGATGSGKSVAINALICSVIMKTSPDKARMILVDPKMLELSVYEGIPHLMMPVVTDPHKAASTLRWAVQEMERRYRLMQFTAVRNVNNLNELWKKSSKEKRQSLLKDYYDEYGEELETLELSYLLIVIDELADLMLTAPKEIETLIQRLAQKARASGIHLVLATQRPSVDIITGVIKANLPSRISFQVVSKHDSRTILDQIGAEKLLGKGDMLFQKPGVNKTERIQGAFVSDDEVTDLAEQVKKQNPAACYDEELMKWVEKDSNSNSGEHVFNSNDQDDVKFEEAIEIASTNGTISASFLQRQLKIGYNRAARIVENMEKKGFVSGPDGAKPRKWLGPK